MWRDISEVTFDDGEVQFTDYGLSGIPVFQLSSDIAKYVSEGRKLKCVIDFMPEMEDDTFEEFITNRIGQYNGKTVEQFFAGLLNKKKKFNEKTFAPEFDKPKESQ